MATNSVISYIGVIILFTGLILSGIVTVLYSKRASSPQWSNLTWWKKYIYPVIVITATILIMNIGSIIALAYGNTNQVTYEHLVKASKVGTGCSGFFWFSYVYLYFYGIWYERAIARGFIPRISLINFFWGKKK